LKGSRENRYAICKFTQDSRDPIRSFRRHLAMNWTGFTEMSVTTLRSWNNVTDILLKLLPSRCYVYTFIRITKIFDAKSNICFPGNMYVVSKMHLVMFIAENYLTGY